MPALPENPIVTPVPGSKVGTLVGVDVTDHRGCLPSLSSDHPAASRSRARSPRRRTAPARCLLDLYRQQFVAALERQARRRYRLHRRPPAADHRAHDRRAGRPRLVSDECPVGARKEIDSAETLTARTIAIVPAPTTRSAHRPHRVFASPLPPRRSFPSRTSSFVSSSAPLRRENFDLPRGHPHLAAGSR